MKSDLKALVIVSSVLWGHCALAQDTELAKKIYGQSQESVYLIYVNGSDGKAVALGTGFQISAGHLLTNAHVIEGGNPVVAVGPVRIPAKVERVDATADLALLKLDVELTSRVLELSTSKALPGEMVFAIGNPEGLENTISQGLVSGVRTIKGQSLLQITAPISHGSSDGPILDQNGKVVGVAVAILSEGQNLNFAIPASAVQTFLVNSTNGEKKVVLSDLLSQAHALIAEHSNDQYSADDDSSYQIHDREITKTVRLAIEESHDSASLQELACMGVDNELSVAAARKAVSITSTPENRAVLSYTLYTQSWLVDITKKDGESRASTGADKIAKEAEAVGKLAVAEPKGSPALASYSVASALEDEANIAEANVWFQKALIGKPSTCLENETAQIYRGIIRTSRRLGKPAPAEDAFRKLIALGQAGDWDWSGEGDYLASLSRNLDAAIAYETSAELGNKIASCKATVQRFISPKTDIDKTLTNGRSCLSAAMKATKYQEKEFAEFAPNVNAIIAWALNERGVYQEALSYVKQSISLNNDYYFAYSTEAKILANMQRYQESIAAAKDAIRLSDGKYSDDHFNLGSAYFSVENWSSAEISFRKAAELDPSSFAAAYNVALCLQRQGYSGDAVQWYRDSLKRNPSPEEKLEVQNAISRLSR
jgi:tetratricopeptide (TPR) repeat protein